MTPNSSTDVCVPGWKGYKNACNIMSKVVAGRTHETHTATESVATLLPILRPLEIMKPASVFPIIPSLMVSSYNLPENEGDSISSEAVCLTSLLCPLPPCHTFPRPDPPPTPPRTPPPRRPRPPPPPPPSPNPPPDPKKPPPKQPPPSRQRKPERGTHGIEVDDDDKFPLLAAAETTPLQSLLYYIVRTR